MGEWGAVDHLNTSADFLTLYTSKSRTPSHRHTPELKFSPSHQRQRDLLMAADDLDADLQVQQNISCLNQDLTVLGFPSLYDGATFRVPLLVNNAQELLRMHQKSLRIKEDLENRQRRTETDINHLQLTQAKLKESLRLCDRDIVSLQEKERQLVNKNKLLTSKLKAEKDELKRLHSVIQSRDTQFKHELKKKERELSKLKERMHQLLTDKNQERRLGMDILNALQRPDGKRGTWKTNNKQEEEMYRLIITNYEERQKELMLENKELRECLVTMQHELVDMLNQQPSPAKSAALDDSLEESEEDYKSTVSTDVEELSDGYFQMPYEMVGEEIQRSLKDKCHQLKLKINNNAKNNSRSEDTSPEPPGMDESRYKQEIKALNQQISRYRDIIEQQEQLIQHSIAAPETSTVEQSFLHNSDLLDEADRLSKDKTLFYQQKANFEEERRNFTDAAIRLGRERKHFEDEKNSFLQQQFFQLTQSATKPKASKFTSPDGASYRQTAASVNYSPAPRHKLAVQTPTTADLYRTIGLISTEKRGSQGSITSSPLTISPVQQGSSGGGISRHANGSSQHVVSPHTTSSNHSRASSSHSSVTPHNTSRNSPASMTRKQEHMENVKLALFQKAGIENKDYSKPKHHSSSGLP